MQKGEIVTKAGQDQSLERINKKFTEIYFPFGIYSSTIEL